MVVGVAGREDAARLAANLRRELTEAESRLARVTERLAASESRLAVVDRELTEGEEADPRVLEDLGRLANRHQRMSDLFGKFRKRLGLPDPESEEP